MKDLNENIISSIIWNYSSSVIIHGISLLASLFLTTILSPDDFGILAVLYLTLGVASIFIGQGYSVAIIREKELHEDALSTIFWINVLIGIATVLLCFLIGNILGNYFDVKNLEIYLPIFSVAYLFQAINVVPLSILKRDLNFKLFSQAQISAIIIAAVLSLILAYNGSGVYSLIYRALAAAVVVTIIVWIKLRWFPRFVFNMSSLDNIKKFSRDIFFTRIVKYASNQFDNFMVIKLLGTSDMGIYNRAKTFSLIPAREIHTRTKVVAYSALSKIDDKELYNNTLFKFTILLNMLIVPLVLMVVISSDTIIYKYLTEEWYPLIDILKLVGLLAIISSSGLPTQILMSKGLSKPLFKIELINNIVKVLILLLGFLYSDLYTIVLLFVISQLVASVILNVASYRHVDNYQVKVFKYHILPILMGVGVYLLSLLVNIFMDDFTISSLIIKITLAISVYFLYFYKMYPDIITELKIQINIAKENYL